MTFESSPAHQAMLPRCCWSVHRNLKLQKVAGCMRALQRGQNGARFAQSNLQRIHAHRVPVGRKRAADLL